VASLPSSAQRVVDAANALGVPIEVHEFPEGTRTAEDAARAIGVEVGQIVKSLVFTVDGETVLALVSGVNRLDVAALARAAGRDGARVGRPDANTVKAATGYSIGGVPPFGHAQPLSTFVDRDLLSYDVVWAAAGTPRHVFPTTSADLVTITAATVADLRDDT
jgi:prolyl-tRNA editing enzyme YbaK/EbsC (Cys-tRNA(Pro) deacylase)